MQVARETRGFEPVGEEVQFGGGEAEGGAAVEIELTGGGAVDDGGGGAKAWNQHGQPAEAGGIQWHLWPTGNLAGELADLEAGLQAHPGDFPIVINEVGATQNILNQAGGRRAGIGAVVGQQAGEQPAIGPRSGGFDEGVYVWKISPGDAVCLGRAGEGRITGGGASKG